MSRKVVFIGGVWLKNEEQSIINNSNGVVQIAANTLQLALIKGFDSLLDSPVTIISGKFIGAFPNKYKQLFIKEKTFNHVENIEHNDYEVGFLNLPLYKHISKYLHSKKYIKKCCRSISEEDVYVIGYSMTQSIVDSLLYAKKVNSNVKTCLIVPDLPEYMNIGPDRGLFFNFFKKMSSKDIYKKIREIDSFVVLTKYSYERLRVKKPFTVVEGVAVDILSDEISQNEHRIKNIVYTGTLSTKYGVCDLVDAFCRIYGPDLRLVICGSGDGQHYIEEKAKNDKRIQFKGTVSNEDARKIQREAYLLVNPRKSIEEYTKYSFPSKTMEYLVSGRPLIMYKLAGIPDEYNPYIYFVDNGLENTLREVLLKSEKELNIFGMEARRFILSKKNPSAQASKILEMLEKQH